MTPSKQSSKIIQISEKKCSKCLAVKHVDEFYISIYRRSECRLCSLSYEAANRKPHREKYANESVKAARNQYQRDYYSMNREKILKSRFDCKEKSVPTDPKPISLRNAKELA